jgi:RNA polymerase sigma factor (sigma-70 family)
MQTQQLGSVVSFARRLGEAGPYSPGDGELLDRFLTGGEASAFEALLGRHAPMVLGVCQRVLGRCADTEDAFQATFLVLVRRAGSIVPRDRVGRWLYGVAHRVALEARARRARRWARERPIEEPAGPEREPDLERDEARAVVDEEVMRLPERYREAVILCELRGLSRQEAAARLNVPEGTLSSRLAEARRRLARRLSRRGLAPAAGLAALAPAVCPAEAAATAAEAALSFASGDVGSVPAAAAALAREVLSAMMLTKVKLTGVVLLCALACLAGVLCVSASAGDAPQSSPVAAAQQAASEGRPTEAQPRQQDDKKEEKKDDKKEEKKDKDAQRLEALRLKLRQLEEDGKKLLSELKMELETQAKKADEEAANARDALSKAKGREEVRKAQEALRKAHDARHRILIEQAKLQGGLTIRPADRHPANPEKELGLSSESPSAVLAAQLGLPAEQGRVITRVEAGSPAAKAGLKAHDVLLQIDKKPAPSSTAAFRKSLEALAPGAAVELKVTRQGKEQTLSLKAPGEKKDEPKKDQPKKDQPE